MVREMQAQVGQDKILLMLHKKLSQTLCFLKAQMFATFYMVKHGLGYSLLRFFANS